MAAVVQAVCPQCNKQLRIPANWLNQTMRCKHCGQVIQARAASPAVRTATPPPRPAKGRAADNKQPRPAPTVPRTARTPASPPPAAPLIAAPVATLAPAARHAKGPQDHFDDLETPIGGTVSKRRRRKARRNWLPLVFVFLFLTGGLAAAGYFAWPKIVASLHGDRSVALGKDGPGDLSAETTPPSKNNPKNADPTKRPGQGKNPELDPTKNPQDRNPFPRRALIISVHNYLYANFAPSGPPGAAARSMANFYRGLSSANDKTAGLKIPANQVLHLSDAAAKGKERIPLKGVIEETITQFLGESRPQDRIMVFFVGYGVEIGDQAFLVPIEGEMETAETLIPLTWVYAQLEKCKARQKVLVVDVARFSPTEGRERPDGGPLGEKFQAVLAKPPAGVQVWSACSAGQQSYATDDSPMGLFLDLLYESITTTKAGKSLQGVIQRSSDPFPLQQLNDLINKQMAAELKPLKLEQVCKLYGKEIDTGAKYDPKDGLAKTPTLPPPPNLAVNQKSMQVVKGVLDEVGVPPVKLSRYDNGLRFDMLPPFKETTLDTFAGGGAPPEDSKLRAALMKARAVLWAVAADSKDLTGPLNMEVRKVKADVKVNLTVLREGYRFPASEGPFKNQILNDEKEVAKILGALTDAHDDLKAAGEDREKESKRWQANYDFMVARLEAQIAYLYEYQSMLGQMRKELPPRDAALHGGWRLAAQTTLQGDAAGKKMEKSSRKILDKMVKDYAGTPWEVLAKREKLTALGLEWKATR